MNYTSENTVDALHINLIKLHLFILKVCDSYNDGMCVILFVK